MKNSYSDAICTQGPHWPARQVRAPVNASDAAAFERSCRLLNDVQLGMRENAFYLTYQPKMDLKSGVYTSAEALLRWNHPELGAISPAEFIPLVEKTALIHPLTAWVIRNALDQLKRWHALGMRIKMAINLSASNFENPDICQRLRMACFERGIDPRVVEVECTEGLWMEGAGVLQTLNDIRGLGIAIALDDFGTGYSNFSYLQKVPATIIKLDQSLIRNMDTNSHDRKIVKSMITLSRGLGYRIVAEGVETATALCLLRLWGCDEAQGYLLSKPLMPIAFEEHVRCFNRSGKPVEDLWSQLAQEEPCHA